MECTGYNTYDRIAPPTNPQACYCTAANLFDWGVNQMPFLSFLIHRFVCRLAFQNPGASHCISVSMYCHAFFSAFHPQDTVSVHWAFPSGKNPVLNNARNGTVPLKHVKCCLSPLTEKWWWFFFSYRNRETGIKMPNTLIFVLTLSSGGGGIR